MTNFNALFLSPQWLKEYHTKYPHGLSVLENLIEWLNQVNELIDYVNMTPDKIVEILTQWRDDGTLGEIIDDFLNNVQKQVTNLNTVSVKNYGAMGDGVQDDTIFIQNAFNAALKGQTVLFPRGTYKVSKNITLPLYPANDHPCLSIYDKADIRISGHGAVLKVEEHGQGILEIRKSKNIIIEGLILEGAGNFIPLFGTTGRGEKGDATAGYKTDDYWGVHRNNSYDTSAAWGMYNGGYIGNVANGLLIYEESKNITVKNVEASGFNYAGISVGAFDPDKYYSEDVFLVNCYSHDNYGCNFNIHNGINTKVQECISERAGHPDADFAAHATVDPGYGVTLRKSANYAYETLIENCVFRNNKRKSIDAHGGIGITVKNNLIIGGSWAGAIALFDSYVPSAIGRIEVTGNTIRNIDVITGFGRAIDVEGLLGKTYPLVKIQDNRIVSCRFGSSDIYVRYAKHAQVSGNHIENHLQIQRDRLHSINVADCTSVNIHNNYVDITRLNELVALAHSCIKSDRTVRALIHDNTLLSRAHTIWCEGTSYKAEIYHNYNIMTGAGPTEQPILDDNNTGRKINNIYEGNVAVPTELL